jgi:hypothetical protein
MTPRTIDGWEQPRRPQNHRWRYEYNKTIGQIDLKISTDEPQNKFEGEITDRMSGNRIMDIFYDQEGWRSLIPGVTPNGKDYIKPGPTIQTFNNMEELAAFMVAKAGEIEAERSA